MSQASWNSCSHSSTDISSTHKKRRKKQESMMVVWSKGWWDKATSATFAATVKSFEKHRHVISSCCAAVAPVAAAAFRKASIRLQWRRRELPETLIVEQKVFKLLFSNAAPKHISLARKCSRHCKENKEFALFS